MKTFLGVLMGTITLFSANAIAQVTTGSGTAGKIPVWTGAHAQGNSIITQSGSNIGIGTAAPTSPLTILTGGASPAIYARDTAGGTAVWGVANSGFGLRGNSTSGTGVAGYSTSYVGVLGSSVNNFGVWGNHSGTTGTQPGVRGQTSSTDPGSSGVGGFAGNGVGIYGQSSNSDGVLGIGGANGVKGQCNLQDGNGVFGLANLGASAYAVFGSSSTGSGVVGSTTGAGDGVLGTATGANSYGGNFMSNNYRGGVAVGGNGAFDFYVRNTGSGTGLRVDSNLDIGGDFFAAGSKSGYVVDQMQNADTTALELGDVVVIAENSAPPILGTIPVPRVRLATAANDTAVVGIVDRVTYVPAEKIRAQYEAQQQADREAARQALASQSGGKVLPKANIDGRISDSLGTVHADAAVRAEQGAYCSVVTLGAFKAVKVDANYGAIRAGDLLTTSWHAGYAMKVQDKVAASGAVLGKALGSLATGTGTVPVLVTLK
jgi:hypothetical protein